MVVHLNETFPEKCEALGDAKIRETVKYGIQRSASYGITSEGDVRKYIDLMLMFGLDFDQDPQLPWGLCDPRQSGNNKPDHKNQSPLQGTEEAGEARKSKPWRIVTRSAADR